MIDKLTISPALSASLLFNFKFSTKKKLQKLMIATQYFRNRLR